MRVSNRRKPCRSGLAALELGLCLPMLCFVMSFVIDYGRLFHDVAVVQDCARNGALFGCGVLKSSSFQSVAEAALANADGLSSTPTITTTSGTDAGGNAYCEVTVTYTFHTISPYPGVPSAVTFSRKLRMAKPS